MPREKDPRQSTDEPPGRTHEPANVHSSRLPAPHSDSRGADVIVDFTVDSGLLHVVIRNIGTGPAQRIRVTFDPSFTGVGGISIPELALFHKLEFLAPGSELRAFVDSIAAHFANEQPEAIVATVTFHDDRGRGYRRRIRHDLGIHRDLPRAHGRGG